MRRRSFTKLSMVSTLGLMLPFPKNSPENFQENNQIDNVFLIDLLTDWCDGMLAHQINEPHDATRHGGLWCPSCQTIHGRCMDAVYPFLYLADLTENPKYLKAGIEVFEWSKNVSTPDGAWTVMPDPNTWKGISVFGAIALAETLKYHGHLLPENTKKTWKERLEKVGEYIFKTYDMTFTNINYGFTAVYGLHLIGSVLKNEKFKERSKSLASEIKNWLTEPNKLIFGEGKPSNKKSEKGLQAVDLGYNVEETIVGVVMYAIEENDKELIDLLKKSMEGHLEFMLPDGSWDNSWGTRQYKWSYWGSRTTDGCQPAFTALAHLNPAFGKAAYLNTILLKNCTKSGLIHGGPHYISYGAKPCIHHTFSHAKVLATMLNENKNLDKLNSKAVLPREKNYGIKHFPEIDVWLVSKAGWKATISAYDFIYREDAQQASGGSLGVLYHEKVGTLFAGSMAKYVPVEVFNQQTLPNNEEFALTPRIETYYEGTWFTNLYDLKAKVKEISNKESSVIESEVRLLNDARKSNSPVQSTFKMSYHFSEKGFEIKTRRSDTQPTNYEATLVLPIVSKSSEKVTQISANKIKIEKENGTVIIEANVPLAIKKTPNQRVFNLVPGFEAVPIMAKFGLDNKEEIVCKITVK